MVNRTLCHYTPPRRAALPTVTAAACLTVGFALRFALPGVGLAALGRIGAGALIVIGIALAMRWLARSYHYALEQHENGQIDLTVTTTLGYRQSTVCRIDLNRITLITPQARRKPKPPHPCYHYINEPYPKSVTLLTIDDPDGISTVRITPSAEMLNLLRIFGTPIIDSVEKG